MALTCILDEGDEILIPEPFYPNYNTFVSVTGGVIRLSHQLRRRATATPTGRESSP